MNIATPHLPTPVGLLRRAARPTRAMSSRRIATSRVVPAGPFRRRNDRHDSDRNTSLTDLALRQFGDIHSLHR